MKSRKSLARDVMYTSATRAGHVYDVKNVIKMAAFTAVFSLLLNVDFSYKLDHESTEKLLLVHYKNTILLNRIMIFFSA